MPAHRTCGTILTLRKTGYNFFEEAIFYDFTAIDETTKDCHRRGRVPGLRADGSAAMVESAFPEIKLIRSSIGLEDTDFWLPVGVDDLQEPLADRFGETGTE